MFKQKYIMCKDAEAIETMVDSGNYEKFSIARLRRVKRHWKMVSPMNLTESEIYWDLIKILDFILSLIRQ